MTLRELTEGDVIGSSVDSCNDVGIYFLIRSGKIVYVGQSRAPYKRVRSHRRDKVFDRFMVMPCSPYSLCDVEAFLIKRFKPILNISLNPDYADFDCCGHDRLRYLILEDFNAGGYSVERFKERLKELLIGDIEMPDGFSDVYAMQISAVPSVPKGVGIKKIVWGKHAMVFNIDGVYYACGVGGSIVVLNGRPYRIDKKKAFINVGNLSPISPFDDEYVSPLDNKCEFTNPFL